MLRFTFVGVSILLLLSCSNEDPSAPEVADIPRTEVYVTNFSAERILEVYLRPAGTEAWGANWIVQPIGGGNLYARLGAVRSGRFDVRMVGELTIEETLDLNLVGDAIGIAFHALPMVIEGHTGAYGSDETKPAPSRPAGGVTARPAIYFSVNSIPAKKPKSLDLASNSPSAMGLVSPR